MPREGARLTLPSRPQTAMGRALATRALALADALQVDGGRPPGDLVDLTAPETPEVPAHVRDAAKSALDRGETHYTTRPGVVPLREAIARRSTEQGFPATVESVVVTNGGAEALYIALQTLLARGQRILVADPIRPNVVEMIGFLGAEPVRLPADAAHRFVPNAEDVAAADAVALLLASPSPVTGVALPPDALERLVATAIGRGMAVILDRSLASAHYDPEPARFPNPDLGSQVVTVGSFSTGHGLAGWRVGWFAAPEGNIPKLRELKQALSICTTAVSQYAALAAIEGPDGWLVDRRSGFARRRDKAMARLAAAGLGTVAPDAYPSLLIDVRPLDADDRRVAARLRDVAGVLVMAGSTFGPATAGFVRIDLGVPAAALNDGIERIARLAAGGSTP
jgi:aspartate aminotransferase